MRLASAFSTATVSAITRFVIVMQCCHASLRTSDVDHSRFGLMSGDVVEDERPVDVAVGASMAGAGHDGKFRARDGPVEPGRLLDVDKLVTVPGDDQGGVGDGGELIVAVGGKGQPQLGDLAQEPHPVVTAGRVDMRGPQVGEVVAELDGD